MSWSDPKADPVGDVRRYMREATTLPDPYRLFKKEYQADWGRWSVRPTLGIEIDGKEVKVRLPYPRQRFLKATWLAGEEAFRLYDHVVHYRERHYSDYWMAQYKPACICSCGWKAGGDDCGTRAEAHIKRLRDWLDDHPEEEAMAALGGTINWPSSTSLRKHHKGVAWNKKRKK